MKKTIIVCCLVIMLFSLLAGCANESNSNSNANATSSAQTEKELSTHQIEQKLKDIFFEKVEHALLMCSLSPKNEVDSKLTISETRYSNLIIRETSKNNYRVEAVVYAADRFGNLLGVDESVSVEIEMSPYGEVNDISNVSIYFSEID